MLKNEKEELDIFSEKKHPCRKTYLHARPVYFSIRLEYRINVETIPVQRPLPRFPSMMHRRNPCRFYVGKSGEYNLCYGVATLLFSL